MCDFFNDKINLKGKILLVVFMLEVKFDGVDLIEVIMLKVYVVGVSFKGNLLF